MIVVTKCYTLRLENIHIELLCINEVSYRNAHIKIHIQNIMHCYVNQIYYNE